MNGSVLVQRIFDNQVISYKVYECVNTQCDFDELFNRVCHTLEEDDSFFVLDRCRLARSRKFWRVGGSAPIPMVVDSWRITYTSKARYDILQSYRKLGLTPPPDFKYVYELEIQWTHDPVSLPF